MDLAGADRESLLAELKRQLNNGCVDFGEAQDTLWENVALCDDTVLADYLEHGKVTDDVIASLIAQRKLFPCYFGSALKLSGIDNFLQGLERYTRCPDYPSAFGAKVYKIARDSQGNRLTYMKVTGGSLKVKALVTNLPAGPSGKRSLGRKNRPDPYLFRRQISNGGGSHGRYCLCGNGAKPHPSGRGAGRRSRVCTSAAHAGTVLSGFAARRL
jgi:hypothetical protein